MRTALAADEPEPPRAPIVSLPFATTTANTSAYWWADAAPTWASTRSTTTAWVGEQIGEIEGSSRVD